MPRRSPTAPALISPLRGGGVRIRIQRTYRRRMEATTCSPPSKEIEIHHRRLAGGRRVLRPRAASATRERVGCYILAMLRPSRRNRRVGRSKRIRKAAGAQPLLCRGRHPRRPTSDVSHRRICRPWPASAPLPEPCWCCSADGATRRGNGSSAAAREDGERYMICADTQVPTPAAPRP